MATEFCPQCGNPRVGALRFCRQCQFDFDTVPPAAGPVRSPLVPQPVPAATNVPMLAGLAWLLGAALTGYLAYQQWSLGSTFGSADYQATAAWNAFTALVTLYFGARLIASPSRRLLDWSAAWAILSVASGVVQIATAGLVGDVFVMSVIAAAVAGVLSFVGRQQWAAEDRRAPTVMAPGAAPWPLSPATTSPAAEPTAAISPTVPRTSRRLPIAEALVLVLIVGAIGVGGYILLNSRGPSGSATTPTPKPTVNVVTQTSPPIEEPLDVAFGEPVDLVDGEGQALGSVTVVEARRPELMQGLPPDPGNRYVIAKVRYEATAAWSYNMFDWVLHDVSQNQYEPVGYAPDPMLSSGTLSAGFQVQGWVGFEVPISTRDAWLDMRSGDGSLIFSVKVD